MYQLAIIGGGPAGYSAAFQAVKNGLKVVIFEGDEIGGTCLNRGCVPTKFLAHVAELYNSHTKMGRYGLTVNNCLIEYSKTLSENDRIIQTLRDGLEKQLLSKKIDIIKHKAKIINKNTVCAGNKSYEVENILIATGSKTKKSFVANAITSDEILMLSDIPENLNVMGGGIVAVEFANIFSLLGTNVNIHIRGERILKNWDKDIATRLTQKLCTQGVSIYTKRTEEQMKELESQLTLSAIGREPVIDEVFGHGLGIKCDNGIVVDCNGKTSIDNIYAAGDVTSNSVQLAHVAMSEGKRVVDYITGKGNRGKKTVIKCIYVSPEIATVGITESDAKMLSNKIVSAKVTTYSNARTIISNNDRGFIKLFADVKTKKIVGAELVCDRATDIIPYLALAIENEIDLEELRHTVFPHPSFCEVIGEAVDVLVAKLC